MKTVLALFLFGFFCFKSFSQSKNNVSFSYGAISTAPIGNSLGGAGYTYQGSGIFGFAYIRSLNNWLGLEVGLAYNKNQVQSQSAPGLYNTPIIENGASDLVSIPVNLRFTFLRYLFVNTGIMADFQTNRENSIRSDLSGLGFELGIGVKYSFKQVSVTANPVIQAHSHFAESGVRFGVGYDF